MQCAHSFPWEPCYPSRPQDCTYGEQHRGSKMLNIWVALSIKLWPPQRTHRKSTCGTSKHASLLQLCGSFHRSTSERLFSPWSPFFYKGTHHLPILIIGTGLDEALARCSEEDPSNHLIHYFPLSLFAWLRTSNRFYSGFPTRNEGWMAKHQGCVQAISTPSAFFPSIGPIVHMLHSTASISYCSVVFLEALMARYESNISFPPLLNIAS